MARYLLDTDSGIDFLYNIAGSVALPQDLYSRGDTLCTCDIVIAEVYAGLHPHEHARADQFFSSLQFFPASAHAARKAGEWRYAFARRGQSLPTTDCLIAAVADQH